MWYYKNQSFNNNKAKGQAGVVRVSQYNDNRGTLNWAYYDANRRGSLIYIDPNNNVRVLAENPPDAAMQSITSITAKIDKIGSAEGVEAAFKAERTIAELGKRTAAVNMLRDALYRVNELYYATVDNEKNNYNFKKKIYKDWKAEKEKKKDTPVNDDVLFRRLDALTTNEKELDAVILKHEIVKSVEEWIGENKNAETILDNLKAMDLSSIKGNRTLNSNQLVGIIDSILTKVVDVSKAESAAETKIALYQKEKAESEKEVNQKAQNNKKTLIEQCKSFIDKDKSKEVQQEQFIKCVNDTQAN